MPIKFTYANKIKKHQIHYFFRFFQKWRQENHIRNRRLKQIIIAALRLIGTLEKVKLPTFNCTIKKESLTTDHGTKLVMIYQADLYDVKVTSKPIPNSTQLFPIPIFKLILLNLLFRFSRHIISWFMFPHYLSFFGSYLLFPTWDHMAEYILYCLSSKSQLLDVNVYHTWLTKHNINQFFNESSMLLLAQKYC